MLCRIYFIPILPGQEQKQAASKHEPATNAPVSVLLRCPCLGPRFLDPCCSGHLALSGRPSGRGASDNLAARPPPRFLPVPLAMVLRVLSTEGCDPQLGACAAPALVLWKVGQEDAGAGCVSAVSAVTMLGLCLNVHKQKSPLQPPLAPPSKDKSMQPLKTREGKRTPLGVLKTLCHS